VNTLTGTPVMRLANLCLTENAQPFDLDLHSGQVVTLAGLEGHGQQRLLEVLSGQARFPDGTMQMADARGRTVSGVSRSLRDAYAKGIVYVPRDRKTQGILPSLSVLENFAVATLSDYATGGIVRPRSLRRRYAEFADRLGIVAADSASPIRSLSGGNQQKVLLARWLAAAPRMLLLNDPSRGVDHPTRVSLYEIYREVAAEGAAVVLLSTELEEVLAVGDVIVVFRDATISAHLTGEDRTRERILSAMFGGHDE
jgi:ABC-type sugar transport system ATPase subunit